MPFPERVALCVSRHTRFAGAQCAATHWNCVISWLERSASTSSTRTVPCPCWKMPETYGISVAGSLICRSRIRTISVTDSIVVPQAYRVHRQVADLLAQMKAIARRHSPDGPPLLKTGSSQICVPSVRLGEVRVPLLCCQTRQNPGKHHALPGAIANREEEPVLRLGEHVRECAMTLKRLPQDPRARQTR